MQDFVDSLIESQNKDKIDLTKPFLVTAQIELTDQGTFDVSRLSYLSSSGDSKVIQLVKSGIEAVGESEFPIFLINFDIKKFRLLVKQDNNSFSIQIASTMKSPELAKTVTSGLNGLITVSKYIKKSEVNGGERDAAKRQNEKDQLILLQNTSITSQDRNFILKMELPKAKAHEILKRNLEKESEKRNKKSQM